MWKFSCTIFLCHNHSCTFIVFTEDLFTCVCNYNGGRSASCILVAAVLEVLVCKTEPRNAGTLVTVAVKKDGTIFADMFALTEKGCSRILAHSSERKERRKHLQCGDSTILAR